ncbi:MAG: hypothetical protein GY866_05225 [Proteobacteria bacterium]|nr:hypothetical protein [Pseudomonadota bacterium]
MVSAKKQVYTRLKARESAAGDLLEWYETHRIEYRQPKNFAKPLDYGLYRHLVSNVIRHRRKYDFLIENLANRTVRKLDREVVVCLMLGLAQLEPDLRMDEYAAVNETVDLIAAMGKPFLKGFVNANLRSYLRKKDRLLDAFDREKLEVRTSHADWMAKRWREQYGDSATAQICEANNILPRVRVVVNPGFDKSAVKADLNSKGYEMTDCHSEGWTVKNPSGLFETEWEKLGAFLIQDSSSQLINTLIKSLPKRCVLDACAAPGGKLFHMEWSYGAEIEELVALDISKSRIRRLQANREKYASQARIFLMDAAKSALKKQFDLVLVDAPCSSTGTIQKHPEIKWSRRVADFRRNQNVQLALLQELSNNVATGGHLLYITCSLENEENQQVVGKFLKNNHMTFRSIPFESRQIDPKFLTAEGYYQCLPDRDHMGMFAALVRKIE